jgi:hypothetical protein
LLHLRVFRLTLAREADIPGDGGEVIVKIVCKTASEQAKTLESLIANVVGLFQLPRCDVSEEREDPFAASVNANLKPPAACRVVKIEPVPPPIEERFVKRFFVTLKFLVGKTIPEAQTDQVVSTAED